MPKYPYSIGVFGLVLKKWQKTNTPINSCFRGKIPLSNRMKTLKLKPNFAEEENMTDIYYYGYFNTGFRGICLNIRAFGRGIHGKDKK